MKSRHSRSQGLFPLQLSWNIHQTYRFLLLSKTKGTLGSFRIKPFFTVFFHQFLLCIVKVYAFFLLVLCIKKWYRQIFVDIQTYHFFDILRIFNNFNIMDSFFSDYPFPDNPFWPKVSPLQTKPWKD